MKILLFGKDGQLGWELQRSLAILGEVVALSIKSQDYCGDFTQPHDIIKTIRSVAPDFIVNAAAYTAVDSAENETGLARTINALTPGLIAEEAKRLGAWLIHYSTDYVFNGDGTQASKENDPTQPINVYGKTKLEGEQAIQASGCQFLIFRTSWVYSVHGINFVKTMLRLAQERTNLSIVDDQIGAPTGAELLADITAHIIPIVAQNPELAGLYHLTASSETSWYRYACFVIHFAQQAGLALKVTPETIQPITSDEYPTPALRPKNSRLDCSKLQNTFNLSLPHWQTGVDRVLTELLLHRQ
jgi:dTDP-4-dehydrorhamnose reductase